jgi:uncharacterized membrane protein YgcG
MAEAPKHEQRPTGLEEWPTRRKIQVLVGASAVVVLLTALFTALQTSNGKPNEVATTAQPTTAQPTTAQQEIFKEPADAAGPDPFGPSAVAPGIASTSSVSALNTHDGGANIPGDTPAIYGGTRGNAGIEPAQIASYLHSDPAKSAAWARAEGIEPAGVPAYLSGLTPVVLRTDTRVTTFGWRNGNAVPRQSVLQAGTAVLVNALGQPRVRAAGGNPLQNPAPTSGTPDYAGSSWQGFDPKNVPVITATAHPMTKFVLDDLSTGQNFVRPVGTLGQADRLPGAPAPLAAAPGTAPSSSLPPGGPPAHPMVPDAVDQPSETTNDSDDYHGDDSDSDGDDSDGDGDGYSHHDGDGGHHHGGGHGDGHGGGSTGGHGGGHGGGGGHKGSHR